MEPAQPHQNLCALDVFQNVLNAELVKSIHVYETEADGTNASKNEVSVVQREFMFSPASYKQIGSVKNVCRKDSLEDFVVRVRKGEEVGLWTCIFHYKWKLPASTFNFPNILDLARNPHLRNIPELANDLDHILKLSQTVQTVLPPLVAFSPDCSCETCYDSMMRNESFQKQNVHAEESHCKDCLQIHKEYYSRNEDDCIQNKLPVSGYQYTNKESSIGTSKSRSKKTACRTDDRHIHRAPTRLVSKIGFQDLSNYFHLPMREASRRLKVGLTVLKRKCRELGIPRWPHRKLKSLDSLIHDLQEEAKRQEREDQTAARAVLKRIRILETERQLITQRPCIDIQTDTKRFRQDIFKRRHMAKALLKNGDSSNSTSEEGDLSGDATSVSTILTLMINEDITSRSNNSVIKSHAALVPRTEDS